MMKRVFVSTSCLGGSRDLQEILERYEACGIKNVELSGGLDYAVDVESSIKKYSHLNFIIHKALSRNQVKLGFLLAINCFIPDIIANVVAYSGQI